MSVIIETLENYNVPFTILLSREWYHGFEIYPRSRRLHYSFPFYPLCRSSCRHVNSANLSANLLCSILVGIPCLSFFENNAFLCPGGKPAALSAGLPFSRIRGDNFILLHYIPRSSVKIGSSKDYRIICLTSGPSSKDTASKMST